MNWLLRYRRRKTSRRVGAELAPHRQPWRATSYLVVAMHILQVTE